jgi:hypothetical protein
MAHELLNTLKTLERNENILEPEKHANPNRIPRRNPTEHARGGSHFNGRPSRGLPDVRVPRNSLATRTDRADIYGNLDCEKLHNQAIF